MDVCIICKCVQAEHVRMCVCVSSFVFNFFPHLPTPLGARTKRVYNNVYDSIPLVHTCMVHVRPNELEKEKKRTVLNC